MSIGIMTVIGGATLALMVTPVPANCAPAGGGTIAVTAQDGVDREDPLKQISLDAVATALGMKGFTILNDPDHAAYIAEVVATRTDVGSSIVRGRPPAPIVTGMAVTIPTSRGQSVVVPLERAEIVIRIRRRGEQQMFWHGAAVTVRSVGAGGTGAEQVAATLSQAALGPYPHIVASPIGIP